MNSIKMTLNIMYFNYIILSRISGFNRMHFDVYLSPQIILYGKYIFIKWLRFISIKSHQKSKKSSKRKHSLSYKRVYILV
jgi:hypothetical protein